MSIIGISGKKQSGKDTVGKIIQYLTDEYAIIDKLSYEEWLVEYEEIESRFEKFQPTASSYKIKKFADKIKDILCMMIGCTREQLEDEEFKNTELGEEWWYFAETMDHSKIPYLENKDILTGKFPVWKPTPRLFLQLIGTECGRMIIHPNVWVTSLMVEYKVIPNYDEFPIMFEEYPDWIITDVRFPNEIKAINKFDNLIIRVNRQRYPNGLYKITEGTYTGAKGYEQFEDALKKEVGIVEHPSEIALDKFGFEYVIENDGTLLELIEKVKIILTNKGILQ